MPLTLTITLTVRGKNQKSEFNQDDAISISTLITNCCNTKWLKTAVVSSIACMIDSILSYCSAAKLLLQVFITLGYVLSPPDECIILRILQ